MQFMFAHTRTLVAGAALAILGSLGGACSKDNAGGPLPGVAPAVNEKDMKDATGTARSAASDPAQMPTPITADLVFSQRCATCHGADGKGTGPAAKALNPKPRDYSDPNWQRSVTDEMIKKTIVEGGPAVGKSSLMAPNADLADKPIVLDELVKIVRSFGPHSG